MPPVGVHRAPGGMGHLIAASALCFCITEGRCVLLREPHHHRNREVPMSIQTAGPAAARRTALWPWAAAWAVVAVPAALVLLVLGEALLNHWTGVPGDSHQGWVLLGIV